MEGFCVLLERLSGSGQTTAQTIKAAIGKKINRLEFSGVRIDVYMEDGTAFTLYDNGQSCCENRYMTTDDDPRQFSGDTLVGIEIADAPSIADTEGIDHEVQFLKIRTDRGAMTVETHNEHNGYYGGFSVIAEPIETEDK